MSRRFVNIFACTLVLLASVKLSVAQTYPSKPVRLMVPYAAGGGADNIARALSPKLAERLGQPLLVENKPGAGGTVAADLVAKSPADGYTLLIIDVSHAMGAGFKLPYDALEDFTPISQVVTGANILVVNPSVPADSVSALIAYARANQGKLTFGSAGTGTSPHLGVELLKLLAGVQMVHVPYKGVAPATVDLLGGRIDLMIGGVSVALPHIRGGKLRALAVTSGKRVASLPDLPTLSESGVPGYELSTWFGIVGPRGIAVDVVAKINGAILKVLEMPELNAYLRDVGFEVSTSTPSQFADLMRSEIGKWQKVTKEAGVQAAER